MRCNPRFMADPAMPYSHALAKEQADPELLVQVGTYQVGR